MSILANSSYTGSTTHCTLMKPITITKSTTILRRAEPQSISWYPWEELVSFMESKQEELSLPLYLTLSKVKRPWK